MGIIKLSGKPRSKLIRQPLLPSKPEDTEDDEHLGLFMSALKMVHSAAMGDSMSPEDLEHQRSGQELLGKLTTPMVGMEWEPFDLNGIPSAWAKPDRPHDTKHIVLYCHGGGYTCGGLNVARMLGSRLSSVLNWDVLCFAYRLAPEFPYPAAVEDALAMWDYLMYQGYGAGDVVLAGDSAGGNLALELTLKLKQQGRRLPGAMLLFSPWTDMTCSGHSHQVNGAIDPILTSDYIHAVRAAYSGGRTDWNSPEFSPIFGKLDGFPPTLIQAGTNEILLSDSELLHRQLRKQGCQAQLEIYPEAWHVFQMYPSRKAAQALNAAARFIFSLSR